MIEDHTGKQSGGPRPSTLLLHPKVYDIMRVWVKEHPNHTAEEFAIKVLKETRKVLANR